MDIRNLTNEEICRITMSQDSSPLERELAQRLEAIMFREGADNDCTCAECKPELWS